MSRTINSSLLSALTGSLVQPFFAIELFFDERTVLDVNGQALEVGPVRLWTGIGNRTINTGSNQTFLGTGALLNLGAADEVSDLSAKSMSLTLTGLDTTLVSLALKEPYQRRQAKIWLGEKSVSEVVQIFSGQMNTMNIEDTPDGATVQLTIESKLVELERARNWRYTDENHQSRQSGDTFFSYVQAIQDVQVAWGKRAS